MVAQMVQNSVAFAICVQYWIIYIHSHLICIQCDLIYIQSHYSASSCLYSVISYLYLVSSYLLLVLSYIYSVSSYLLLVLSYIYSVSSYLYSIRSYLIYSVSSYLYSVTSVTIKLEELHSYNFIYFIGGTVKLHTDEIVNKSVVFRNTETSHYSCLKNERKFFKKENVAKIMTVAYLRGCVGCGRTPLRILSAIFRMLSALFCPLIRFKIRTL